MKDLKRVKVRNIIQWISIVISLILFSLLIQSIFVVAHAYCPYASVCFGVMGINPSFGQFLYTYAIIAGIIIVLLSIFIGRKFCGYVCPIGTIQELVYKINPKSEKPKSHKFPIKLHKFLSVFKYVILIITIVLVLVSFQFIFMKFCPILAIAHPQNITIAGILSLLIIFVVGIFVERFWCNYLCPYAALMNVFLWLGKIVRIPRSKILRNMEACIDCRLCSKHCPMQIPVHDKQYIDNIDCIHCYRCLAKCPQQKGLTVHFTKE